MWNGVRFRTVAGGPIAATVTRLPGTIRRVVPAQGILEERASELLYRSAGRRRTFGPDEWREQMSSIRSGAPSIFALSLFLAAPGAATAAEVASGLLGRAVYVADSTLDRILILVDRDGSGLIEPDAPGELTVFYDDLSPGPDLSIPTALLPGPNGELYLLDGGTLD